MEVYRRQLKAIELQIREHLQAAKAVTSAAADAGRGLEEDERKTLDGHLSQVEVLKGKKSEVDAAIATLQRVDDIGKAVTLDPDAQPDRKDGEPPKFKSIGEALTESDGYKALLADGMRGKWTSGIVDVEGKALLDSTGVGAGSGGLLQPDVQPGILPILFQPLTIADLMAPGATSTNLVRYLVESVATSGAAGVPESGAKPESTLEFDATDEPVKKIATFLPVTDEMIEDVPALQSYVNGRLSLFVRQEEERQLLNGAGGDEIDGLIGRIPAPNLGVTSSAAFANAADHVYRAMTVIRLAFLEADAVAMHPNDWERVATMKDEAGRYIGTNPFSGESQPRLWGKPVVVTQAIDEGTALVGSFRAASQIFRRGGLSVEASNSHADFFAHNKTAIRCEERLALAVYRPEAFATADVSGS